MRKMKADESIGKVRMKLFVMVQFKLSVVRLLTYSIANIISLEKMPLQGYKFSRKGV